MWFQGWLDIWRVGAMALATYAAVILILRVSGKRSLSKLNAFDFVVTIAMGSILSSTILLKDTSFSEGAGALLALAALQLCVSLTSRHWHGFAKTIRSEPRLLLRDGVFLDEALDTERIMRDEVEAAIRKDGHGRVEDVTAVVLESDGTLSVICEGKAEDCSALKSVIKPS